MAAGVAHDYNNLLVGVVGGLDLANMAEDAAEREEAIAMVRSATEALQVLSRQLLDVAGGRPMALSSVDLNAVVQASVSTLRIDPDDRRGCASRSIRRRRRSSAQGPRSRRCA